MARGGVPTLSYDPTVVIDHHRPDDRFNPVRGADLLAAVAADTEQFGADAPQLRAVAAGLERVIDEEADALERDLLDRYHCVNPDRDTLAVGDLGGARTPAHYTDLQARLEYLLDKANFTRLEEIDLNAAVRAANSRGLRVRLHPQRVLQLAVWVRGHAVLELRRRSVRKPRGTQQRVAVYRRLAVLARLKDDPNVQLKMFKEIPEQDVEALLPHAEVQMNWYDRLTLMGGGAGLVGSTAGKLVGVASGVLVFSRLLWVLLFGAGALCVRTVLGYRNVRARRDLQRTTNLYYQNLANNAGVIHALVSMFAQEDFKEALLAYAMCQRADGPGATEAAQAGRSADELAQRVQAYLRERFGVDFTFDVHDACATLGRLNLWCDPVRFCAVPPVEAARRLEAHWLARQSQDYHVVRAADGVPAHKPAATPASSCSDAPPKSA